MVVSLPGLDVSPGDLFVSNGAADILNGSNFSGKSFYYTSVVLFLAFCLGLEDWRSGGGGWLSLLLPRHGDYAFRVSLCDFNR